MVNAFHIDLDVKEEKFAKIHYGSKDEGFS